MDKLLERWLLQTSRLGHLYKFRQRLTVVSLGRSSSASNGSGCCTFLGRPRFLPGVVADATCVWAGDGATPSIFPRKYLRHEF
jgi:hypothetical protein